jgi:glycine cleavage system aminomethyltransferase T
VTPETESRDVTGNASLVTSTSTSSAVSVGLALGMVTDDALTIGVALVVEGLTG